ISCIAADTTSPPTSNASFVNVSAQARSGAEASINYYGDKVTFADNSSSGVPISSVDWDLVTPAVGTFAADAAVSGSGKNSVTGYYPCDPSGGADFVSGLGACKISVFGTGVPPATASFVFAERSTNQNGVAQNPPGPPPGVFYSSPIAFRQPLIGILGYNPTTSTLSVLSGGNADASPTQGNTADATFQWTFNPGAVARTGMVVAVPTGASTFTLLVTWKAGYTQSLTGNINQTDLVPEFTMSPASPPGVTVNGTLTLTNAMQKSPATVLNSVDYAIASGNCPANLPAFSPLPPQFISTGSIGVTAPSSAGAYCITLRYNYTPPTGGPTSQSVAHNVTVSIQSNVSLTCDQTSLAVGATLTCTAAGGSASATYRWNWGDDFPPTFTTGPNPNTHVYSSPGGRTVTVSMTDGGSPVTANFAVAVTGGSTGGGSLSATVNGPSSGSIGTPIGFAASATGGSGSYTYAWACDYTVLGGSSQFLSGLQTNSCTYASNGTRVVAVRVSDASSNIIATT
ncbi:MAG TPA: PKD domain-containing protein, partial [Thermoanaerobaculia bacterium]